MLIQNAENLYNFLRRNHVEVEHYNNNIYSYRSGSFILEEFHPDAPKNSLLVPYTYTMYEYQYIEGRKNGTWRCGGRFSKPLILERTIDILYGNKVPGFDWSPYANSFPDFIKYIKETWYPHILDVIKDKGERVRYNTRTQRIAAEEGDHYNKVYVPRYSKIKVKGVDKDIRDEFSYIKSSLSYLELLNLLSEEKFIKKLAQLEDKFSSSETVIEESSLPNVTLEEAQKLVSQSSVEGEMVKTIPSLSEIIHPNDEAIQALNQQMESIPGFQITYMRLREQCLYSARSSRFDIVKDALNQPKEGEFARAFKPQEGQWVLEEETFRRNEGILYVGPAWGLKFKIKDLETGKLFDGLSDNIIHTVTGKMWSEAVSKYRPDLLEEWQPDPDTFYFLASEWCLRTDGYWYERGYIDYYSLFRARLTMKDWMLTHFVSKCRSYGYSIPNGIGGKVLIDGMRDYSRLEEVTSYLKAKAVAVK